MWRSGVAVLLLVLLFVLVADLWFRDPGVSGVADRPSTSTHRYSRADITYTAGTSATPVVATVAPIAADRAQGAAAVGSLRVEANAARVTDLVPTSSRMRDDVFGGELDQLDLTRLPRALSDEGDQVELRGVAGDNGTSPRLNLPALAAVASKKMVPVPRPSLPAETPRVERAQPAASPAPAPAPRPAQGSAGAIADAQRKLIALGYDIGPADGRLGRRTEAAVRDFQKTIRLDADGRIDDRLQARLDAEVRSRAHLRQQELEAMAPAPPRKPEPEQRRGMFGSMMGGFQRLIGRDFDSSRRPDEFTTYCRRNADTWIYDFGREAFVYCGNVIASGVAGHTSGKTTESAANR